LLLDIGQQFRQRGIDLPVDPRLDGQEKIRDLRRDIQDPVSRNGVPPSSHLHVDAA
jgi:hypothetical protein